MDAESEKLLASIIRNARLASLGTLRDGEPSVSMVPFVCAGDFSEFYIHVSRLAQHTMDMQKSRYVSLLIVETDDGRSDPQTLARVTIRGKAESMQVGEPGYTPVKSMYIARFPESEPLFKSNDFDLWRIVSKGGRYVAGYAKAYNLTPEALKKASEH